MSPKIKIFLSVLLAVSSLSSPSVSHAESKADELMRQVYEQRRTQKSQRTDVELVIKDRKGRKRVRHFKMLYKILPGQTKSLLRFYKPADIKGTGLFNIVYDKKGRENEQWIYFPAFRRMDQLSTEEKHQSFMGSDLTNADVAGRKPDEDSHKLVSSGERISVVSSVPRDISDPYSKIETHIIDKIKVPEKIVFYDRSGSLLKTLRSRKIAKIGGMYIVVESEIENHRSGGSTYLTKKSVNFKNIDQKDIVVSKLQNR